MEEHNRKKEEKAKREIAELKAARENAERKLGVTRASALPSAFLEIGGFVGGYKRTLGNWENE